MKRFLTPLLLLMPFAFTHAQSSDNYQPINPNVVLQSSTLPVVTIKTGSQTIDRQTAVEVSVSLQLNGNSTFRPAEGDASLKYWGREAFTHQAKKSFQIVTADGIERWLIALYSDRSYLRSQLTTTLARPFMPDLPVCGHCELVLDGVYYGLYLLLESPTTVSVDMTDYLIAAEMAHDVDCYRFNAEKEDADTQTMLLPLLNTYLGYGNNYAAEGYRTDSWVYQENKLLQAQDDPWKVPIVWAQMTADSEFKAHLRQRWAEQRAGGYSDNRIMEVVDSLAQMLKASGALDRDAQAWPLWGRCLWPNHHVAQSFEDEVLSLKKWITERLAWMDTSMTADEIVIRREPLTIVSGFNADVIVEALPAASHVNADLDDNHFVFFSADCQDDGGLPSDGHLRSEESDVEYQLADYDVNNVLRLGKKGALGTLVLETPIAMSQLFIVAMGGNGDGSYKLTVNYSDGSKAEHNLNVADWGNGGGILSLYRMLSTDGSVSPYHEWYVYEDSVVVDNSKKVTSLSFVSTSELSWDGYQPVVSIFALSAQTEQVISSVKSIEPVPFVVERTVYYDLSGRQLSAPRRGANIVVEYGNGQVRRRVLMRNEK